MMTIRIPSSLVTFTEFNVLVLREDCANWFDEQNHPTPSVEVRPSGLAYTRIIEVKDEELAVEFTLRWL